MSQSKFFLGIALPHRMTRTTFIKMNMKETMDLLKKPYWSILTNVVSLDF